MIFCLLIIYYYKKILLNWIKFLKLDKNLKLIWYKCIDILILMNKFLGEVCPLIVSIQNQSISTIPHLESSRKI